LASVLPPPANTPVMPLSWVAKQPTLLGLYAFARVVPLAEGSAVHVAPASVDTMTKA